MKSLLSWAEAKALADRCRARGGTVVTTNGCFDILHRGHVAYLEQARNLGDLLIVGINSDASVSKIKGAERPLHSESDRAQVLGALRCVDAVSIFKEDTPIEWLKTLQPHIHCKGGDYKAEDLPETSVVKGWGGRVHVLPYVEGVSTTQIIQKMKGKK